MDSNNSFSIDSSGSNLFGNRSGRHSQSASGSSINCLSIMSTSSKLSQTLPTINDYDQESDNKEESIGKTADVNQQNTRQYFDAFEEIDNIKDNDENGHDGQDDEADELASILNAIEAKNECIRNYDYIDYHLTYYHNHFNHDDDNDDFYDVDDREEKEQFEQFGWTQFVSKVYFDDLIENMKIN